MASTPSFPIRADPGPHGYVSVNDPSPFYFKLYSLHCYGRDALIMPPFNPGTQAFTIRDPESLDLYSLQNIKLLYADPCFFADSMPELAFIPTEHSSYAAFLQDPRRMDDDKFALSPSPANSIWAVVRAVRNIGDAYVSLMRSSENQPKVLPRPELLKTDGDFRAVSDLVENEKGVPKPQLLRAIAKLFLYYLRNLAWCLSTQKAVLRCDGMDVARWRADTKEHLLGNELYYVGQIFEKGWNETFASSSIGVVFHSTTTPARFGCVASKAIRAWDLVRRFDPAKSAEERLLLQQGQGLENVLHRCATLDGHPRWEAERVVAQKDHDPLWSEWRSGWGKKPEWMKKQKQREVKPRHPLEVESESDDGGAPVNRYHRPRSGVPSSWTSQPSWNPPRPVREPLPSATSHLPPPLYSSRGRARAYQPGPSRPHPRREPSPVRPLNRNPDFSFHDRPYRNRAHPYHSPRLRQRSPLRSQDRSPVQPESPRRQSPPPLPPLPEPSRREEKRRARSRSFSPAPRRTRSRSRSREETPPRRRDSRSRSPPRRRSSPRARRSPRPSSSSRSLSNERRRRPRSRSPSPRRRSTSSPRPRRSLAPPAAVPQLDEQTLDHLALRLAERLLGQPFNCAPPPLPFPLGPPLSFPTLNAPPG